MDYNSGFSSIPAPIVKIKLTNPWKSNSKDWIGLLDTGSDMSVIPNVDDDSRESLHDYYKKH